MNWNPKDMVGLKTKFQQKQNKMKPTLVADKFIKPLQETFPKTMESAPDEIKQIRERAWQAFLEMGIPSVKNEEFKYTPLRTLAETSYENFPTKTISKDELEKTTLGVPEGARVVFVNGKLSEELSDMSALPTGVTYKKLSQAVLEDWKSVKTHFSNITAYDNAPFVALNTALWEDGVYLHIGKDVVVENPITMVFYSSPNETPASSHIRNLFILEPRSDCKIIEAYLGKEGNYFQNAVTEFYVAENAVCEHVKIQDESLNAHHICTQQTLQQEKSVFHTNNISYGAHLSRTDVNIFLNGEHCECLMNGVYLGSDNQTIDNHTRLDHAKPNCNSFEVYKGILADNATGVFNGKIFVHPDAQKTDAKQTNQALLLSRNASINTKPQLEIFADDVKCTHGATVGQIKEDALFYMMSRGIPRKQAESLLVYAFASEVLEHISIRWLVDRLEKTLFDRLANIDIHTERD